MISDEREQEILINIHIVHWRKSIAYITFSLSLLFIFYIFMRNC